MRIGVDLGGSKIEAIVLSRTGQERARRRITAPHGDYDTTVRAVRDLVTEVRAQAGGGDATIGIGTPGSLSPTTGLLRNANSVWLNGRPLKADLSAALGQPVKLANDADCFAMSEATDGAGKGASSVFGVIIGTGVGGGVVVGGTLLAGANGIAGEWGHNPLADSAPPRTCWCGRVGCIETWLSGPALSADYALSASPAPTVEIAERAGAGEPAAIAAFDRYVERLGRALATVVNVLDPEVIVLGGGVSNVGRLYDDTPAAMRAHVFSDHCATRIVQNSHGDSSGVRGAAWLWKAGTDDN